MKKSLLLLSAFGISLCANAQELRPAKKELTKVYNSLNTPNRVRVDRPVYQKNGNSIFAGCDNTLGSSVNSFTSINGPRTNVWADPTLNTVVFVHRANPGGGVGASGGDLMFDISKDGGTTWSIDQGPIYTDPGATIRGRYPQAVLYNPSGNTNPDNAFIGAMGATTDGAGWIGYTYGNGSLGATLNAQQGYEAFVDPGFIGDVPAGAHMDKNGTFYNSDGQYDVIGLTHTYDSALYFFKGVWDNATSKYNISRTTFPFPVDDDGSGAGIWSYETRTCFNDNGSVGYMTALAHANDQPFACAPNAVLPCVYKTTDGGATWSGNMINLNNLDSLFGGPPPAGYYWSFYYEHDLVVDNQDNLHIFAAAQPLDNVNGQIIVGAGGFMMVDVFTTDQGNTWKARLIGYTMTFDGEWDDNAGATTSDRNRGSVARTWNGDKLFYVYFDTDTTVFAGVGNTLPNAYCVGYDLTTGLSTPVVNLTAGSLAESACIIGNLSYYVFGNTGSYSLPITYQELSTTAGGNPSVGTPCTHHFVCGQMDDNMFTVADNTIYLSTCPLVTSVQEQVADLAVSNPYPNPTNDMISIPVSVSNKADVKLEITNTLGQVVRTFNFADYAGQQVIKVKVGNYAKGLYFATVTANGKSSTVKFSVE